MVYYEGRMKNPTIILSTNGINLIEGGCSLAIGVLPTLGILI
jgi:hypothetical protein